MTAALISSKLGFLVSLSMQAFTMPLINCKVACYILVKEFSGQNVKNGLFIDHVNSFGPSVLK